MKPLKVKCTICLKEETPSSEVLEEISGMIRKYNLKSEQYLHFLNVMSGNCLNSNEHSFEFDDEFLASMNEIVEKTKAETSEIEKLGSVNKEINKEIDEIEIKLNELRTKVQSNDTRTTNLQHELLNNMNDVEKSTKYAIIEIWT